MGVDTTGKNFATRTKLGVISGGYLKTYTEDVTTYGEKRGYSPTVLGASQVFIRPDAEDPAEQFRGAI